MTKSETACAAPGTSRAADDVRDQRRPFLNRGQRALAIATAVAILLSGLNAAVQVARVLVQCWTGRP